MKKTRFFFFILGAILLGFVIRASIYQRTPALPQVGELASAEEQETTTDIQIQSGDTFTALLEAHGVLVATANEILEASKPVYDFAAIRAGKTIVLHASHTTGELERLTYEPSTEEYVSVEKSSDGWTARIQPIEYEIRQKTVRGTIDSSLYETALAQGLDERAVIALAEMFAWQIDFAVDIRTNDSFSMILEERYRNGVYAMPGHIRAAQFNNNSITYKGFFYTQADGIEGYFDEEGNSLQKIFLKSPLQYRYISSRFGKRVDPISRKASTHTGIDYAAPYGTPAVTVGDGTIVFAGWHGGYGYSVDVRHNEMYTTRYGHFSKIAVKTGEKVQQGDIVGYVGSTGWSTGPHLHYEMIKHRSQVDPFNEEVPPTEPLSVELMPAFLEHIKQFSL